MNSVQPEPASPRIRALARAVGGGAAGAHDAFWRDVAATGTPLVEASGEDQHLLVTFLWRAATPAERAGVITQLAPRLIHTGAAPLCALPGTDVWYATFPARRDLRTTYWLSVWPGSDATGCSQSPPSDDAWIVDTRYWRQDPLNLRTTPDDPPASLLVLPDAPPARWSVPPAAHTGAPGGTVLTLQVPSAVLGNERTVWIYTPPAYDPAVGPYDLLVLFDGWAYANCVPTAAILDNLIGGGHLPPTVAVLVGNPDAAARQRELGCCDLFVAFVADDLVPWVRGHYAVSADPARTVVGGSSRGALAAAYVGLRRPDRFGNVLCQSGAFWFSPEGDPESEWLTRQFAATPLQPLRFHLDVGLLEVGEEGGATPTMLAVSRHLRTVLRAKGYDVHYAEFSGGHSYSCWEIALPDALVALRGGARAASTNYAGQPAL